VPDGARADSTLAEVRAIWQQRRPWVYGMVAIGALIAGPLPLVASLVTLAGLLVGRHLVLRRALPWLSPARRLATRATLHLWLLTIALAAFVAHEAVTLLPVLHFFLKAAVALGAAVLYVEGSLLVVADRLRRDAQGARLDAGEWLVPLGLVAVFAGLCAAAVAVAMWVWERVDGAAAWIADQVQALL
jgi:hypothetical protein